MGRKKNKKKKEIIFCYYCDRIFDDEKTLMQHQKAKHFKCPFCYKRLNSAMGLLVHCWQVHKETLEKVPGSVNGRDQFDIEIFGMSGVPPEAKFERQAKYYGDKAGKNPNASTANQFLAGVLPGHQPAAQPVMAMHGMPMMAAPRYPFGAPQMHAGMYRPPVPVHHAHHAPQALVNPHSALPPPRPAPAPRPAPPVRALPPAGRGLPVGQAPVGHQLYGAGRGLPIGQAPRPTYGAVPKAPAPTSYQPYPTQYQAAPPPAAAPPPVASHSVAAAPTAPEPAVQPVAQPAISGKKKTVRIFAHKDISMEELRARHPKYATVR